MGTRTSYVSIYKPADNEVFDEQLNDNADYDLIDAGILYEHNLIVAHTNAPAPHTGHAVLVGTNLYQGSQQVVGASDGLGVLLDTGALAGPGVLTGSRHTLRAHSYDTLDHRRDFILRSRATSNAGAGTLEILTSLDGATPTLLWSLANTGAISATGTLSAGSISTGAITATGALSAASVSTGPVTATGALSASSVAASVAVTSAGWIAAGTVLSNTVGDISANRGNGTAYIWLANGSHYIGFDGTQYILPTSGLTVSGAIQTNGNAYNFSTTTLALTWDGIYHNFFLNQLTFSVNNTRCDVWIGGGSPARNSGAVNTMHVHGTIQGWADNSEGVNQGAVSGNYTLAAAWGAQSAFGGGLLSSSHYPNMNVATWAYGTYADIGDSRGRGLADAWMTYASVDHARKFKLFHEPVRDPLARVRSVTGFYYDHLHRQRLGDPNNPEENFAPEVRHAPIRTKNGRLSTHRTYGFSAADLAQEFPELVTRDADGDPYAVDIDRLVPILWEAVKELAARVEALEAH